MTSSDRTDIAALRARILDHAPDPASDPADFARLIEETRSSIVDGEQAMSSASQVRVRLTGPGVPGHSVPVQSMSSILGALQHSVSSVGTALRRINKVHRGNASTTLDPFELRIQPSVGFGSVVFFLDGPELKTPPTGTQIESTPVDSILDSAVGEVFRLLDKAKDDEPLEIGELRIEIQRLGVRAASALNTLAQMTIDTDIELDLALRSPTGRRKQAELRLRNARSIRDAIDKSRERVESRVLEGRLRTVSDGADLVRIELDDTKRVRLSVDPEVGTALGPLLGQRVRAEVELTIKWSLAESRESRSWKLLSAHRQETLDELNDATET